MTPTPGTPEKMAVRDMFDRIAPRYDLLNRLLSAGIDTRWRRAAVAALCLPVRNQAPVHPPAGGRVLDLCTGTADLLMETLRSSGAGSGLGLDLSWEMLKRGQAKLRRRPGGTAWLCVGDAERLPLRDASFDGALVAFGIRNVGDPLRALSEIRRVLRPGAGLVVLEFGRPPGWLGRLFRLYFRHVLPRLGGWLSGDPGAYRYLPASVDHFWSPDAFEELMHLAGFSATTRRRLSGGIAYIYRGEKV